MRKRTYPHFPPRLPVKPKSFLLSVGLLLCQLSQAAPPANWPAHYPLWWYNDDPANSLIDVSKLSEPENAAPINQGQLLHMAQKAVAELNSELAIAGGAGFGLADLTNSQPRDTFAPVTLGQLKFVASHFYDRFEEIGFAPSSPGYPTHLVLDSGLADTSKSYPWLHDKTVDNESISTLGQVKSLFSWEIAADSDEDGLLDWIEFYLFRSLELLGEQDLDANGINDHYELMLAANLSFPPRPRRSPEMITDVIIVTPEENLFYHSSSTGTLRANQ